MSFVSKYIMMGLWYLQRPGPTMALWCHRGITQDSGFDKNLQPWYTAELGETLLIWAFLPHVLFTLCTISMALNVVVASCTDIKLMKMTQLGIRHIWCPKQCNNDDGRDTWQLLLDSARASLIAMSLLMTYASSFIDDTGDSPHHEESGFQYGHQCWSRI